MNKRIHHSRVENGHSIQYVSAVGGSAEAVGSSFEPANISNAIQYYVVFSKQGPLAPETMDRL